MEDTLGVISLFSIVAQLRVLILVLMEDTLGGFQKLPIKMLQRLNPCFNGRYSRRQCQDMTHKK